MTSSPKLRDYDSKRQNLQRDNLGKIATVESRMYFDDLAKVPDYKNSSAKDVYEMRLQELGQTLGNVLLAIRNDQLLSTMMEEQTSQGFAQQRIREIIEECIDTDREALLKHLSQEYATLESEHHTLEEEYNKV